MIGAGALVDYAPMSRTRHESNYVLLVAMFCAALLIANIGAVKLIAVGPVITDGGALLFPLTYILGDVLTEIFGFNAARRAIFTAMALQITAAVVFWFVTLLPAAPGWGMQDAYASVVGFVPRIVLASVVAFVVGETLNSYVLVWIKERTKERLLWARLIGSTIVGELADTLVFCTIAFYGVITGAEFANYVITGYIYKTLVEVVMLPVTYRVIAALKRAEPDYLPAV